MRPRGAFSPWIPVDRSSMPAERLKNTATAIEHNIYRERPRANFVTKLPNAPQMNPKAEFGLPGDISNAQCGAVGIGVDSGMRC